MAKDDDKAQEPDDATAAAAAEGISEADREYVDVPDDEKPHPSTVMKRELLPGEDA